MLPAVRTTLSGPTQRRTYRRGAGAVVRGLLGRVSCALAAILVVAGLAQAQTYTLTIRGAGTGSGAVTAPAAGGQAAMNCAVANGATSGTCARTYATATQVTLTATALTGSVFTGWAGACAAAGAATSCTVRNLSGAQTATATFQPACTVTVLAGAGGAATITSGGATGACGRSVTVQAAPNANFSFTGWTVGGVLVSSATSYTFTPTVNTAITGSFAPIPQCALTIGTATGGAAALTAGTLAGACGRSVTITATAAAGFRFSGWSDGATASPYTFTVTATNQVITPVFVAQCALALAVSPAGAGTATLTSGTLQGDCGRSVTIAATASATWRFTAFTENGASIGTTTPLTVTVGTARSITATFEAVPQCTLVLAAVPTEGGTVSLSAGSLAGDCGRTVTAVATPAQGYTFTRWSEAAASATYTLTVTQSTQPLSAQFASLTAVRIVISGAQGRVVRGSNGSEVCALGNAATEVTCTVTAGADDVLAAPAANTGFVGWRGACAGRGPCALSRLAGQEVKALFVPVRTISGDVAALDLLTGQGLSAADRELLDQAGNGDGVYNLGDLLAHLERTSQVLSPQVVARMSAATTPLSQPLRVVAPRVVTPRAVRP